VKVCSVDGCDQKRFCKGMCRNHYQHMHAHGVLELPPWPSVAERFTAKSVKMPNGCIEWTGATNRGANGQGGYGKMRVGSKIVLAHRLAWELSNGPIPDGLEVCHKCDVRLCCNPEHLFLGTHRENMHDLKAKGRPQPTNGNERKTHCPQGHEYVGDNVIRTKNGARWCRTCRRKHDREKLKRSQAPSSYHPRLEVTTNYAL